MSVPTLLFVHGWAFDRSFWDLMRGALGELNSVASDRGYFGQIGHPVLSGPVVVVSHSLGSMLTLRHMPPDCIAFVAINGFDCFVATPDTPGVPRRVVNRMLDKFEQEPAEVVADFRRRCGESAPVPALATQRLRDDLTLLRDGDERRRTIEAGIPILSLQGGEDPILSADQRASVFAGAPDLQRAVHPAAGHLLPSSDPIWCAGHIHSFLERLG